MAVSDIHHVDPRVEFWGDKRLWPRNAAGLGVVFLGHVVHHLGRNMFGSGWTGAEPHTASILPIRRHLSADTPPSDIRYACHLLYQNHLSFRQRTDGALALSEPVPMPTPDEWAIAYALSEQHADAARACLNRFWAVVDVLTRLFEQGIVLTGLRPNEAGAVVLLPPGDWFNECYDAWFATCQVDPVHRFSRTPTRYGGHWIYVDEESYLKWLALAFDTVEKGRQSNATATTASSSPNNVAEEASTIDPSAINQPATVDAMATPVPELSDTSAGAPSSTDDPPAPKVKKRGAPTRYNWPLFDEEVVRVAKSGSMPSSDRGFAAQMAEWCSNTWNGEPSQSRIRDRIKRVVQENGLKMPSELAKKTVG